MSDNVTRLARLPMPPRIAILPRDHRGYPIPRFVANVNGKPDFRVMNTDHFKACLRHKFCWICGGQMGGNGVFAVGPMCTVNRISSEPPSHRDCVEYAARVCPFLVIPKAARNDRNLPEHAEMAGVGLLDNPGVTCLWATKFWKPVALPNGILLQMGEPIRTDWMREGREATRKEVYDAMYAGAAKLMRLNSMDAAAEREFNKRFVAALDHLPDE